jgi:hypothetical protein
MPALLDFPLPERSFAGLPLESNLARGNTVARSGLQVIDLDTGRIAHWLFIEGVVEELYDVVALPNVVRPKAFGFKTVEIRFNVWVRGESGSAKRWIAKPGV